MSVGKENLKLFSLGGFTVVTLFVWAVIFDRDKGVLTVAFLDVGQGDAIFIESPNGNQVLVDGGASGQVLRELGSIMSFYDRSIDVVVATHPDQDHIGGLPDVLTRFEVGIVLRSGARNDTGAFETLNRLTEGRALVVRRGMLIDFGDGVYAEILFPDRDVSNIDPNDASIAMRIVYGDTEVMLTGDLPEKVERHLVALGGSLLESDVLKVGHHGSKTSSSELFLGFVKPEYAVISAGKDNRYGHPHPEVVKRFEQFNIPVASTAEEGMIVFESDGELLVRK